MVNRSTGAACDEDAAPSTRLPGTVSVRYAADPAGGEVVTRTARGTVYSAPGATAVSRAPARSVSRWFLATRISICPSPRRCAMIVIDNAKLTVPIENCVLKVRAQRRRILSRITKMNDRVFVRIPVWAGGRAHRSTKLTQNASMSYARHGTGCHAGARVPLPARRSSGRPRAVIHLPG